MILAVPTNPSWLIAVTTYVWGPGAAVSSVPLPPEVVFVPRESSHEARPGPAVPSVHVKDVDTVWPTANVWPVAGEEIVAVGASATTSVRVSELPPCVLSPE